MRHRSTIAVTALALAGLLGGLLSGCGGDGDGDTVEVVEPETGRTADYQYTIPAGTGEAMDRGEEVEILPAELTVKVGEVLEIVNEDDRGHLVGPFFVGEGEKLRQEFTSPGEFQGICTVHPSGQFVLTVT
jgi:plastocyanin